MSYGPGEDEDDDPFPVDENGRARAYQPVRRGLHQLAGHMKDALNFAAGFNPIYQVGEVLTGQNAAGECVSNSQRVFGAVLLAAGPVAHNIGPLGGLFGKTGAIAKKWRQLNRGRLPIRATISELAKYDPVPQIMKDMRTPNGFDYENMKEAFEGTKENGIYYVAEGHHRATAAVNIWIEDGNMTPLQKLIEQFQHTGGPIPNPTYPFPLR